MMMRVPLRNSQTTTITFNNAIYGFGINLGDIHEGAGPSQYNISFGGTLVWSSNDHNPGGLVTATNDVDGVTTVNAGEGVWTFFGYYDPNTPVSEIQIEVISTNSSDNFAIDDITVIRAMCSQDADNDSVPDYLDIDSDNDGIPDNIEGQPTATYLAPSGTVNTSGAFSGLWDNYGTGVTPENTDGIDQADYLDLDSDNDEIPDIEENGMANSIAGIDTDTDGLDNNFEGSNVNDPYDSNDEINDPRDLSRLPDTDGDLSSGGDLDYRDLFDINPPPSATIQFDGVDDYIDSHLDLSGFDQLTSMVWVKLDPSFSSAVVLNQGGFEIFITAAGRVRVKVNNVVLIFPNSNKIELNEWTHISLLFNKDLPNKQLKGYLNGELVAFKSHNGLKAPIVNSTELFTIGKKATSNSKYFKGDIDEVRIFDQVLTEDQMRKILYQEIEENSSSVAGITIPQTIRDYDTSSAISWSALRGYYPMTNIKSRFTFDFSEYNNDGTLHYITSVLEQTAPMPFKTHGEGNSNVEANWLHGDVWNMNELTDSGYAIVKISHDVVVNSKLKTIGLLIDSGKTLTMEGSHEISNSWYLGLDGTIDLKEDSQLVQGIQSDLVTSSEGKILRRQEGSPSKYWYNYWSLPVGRPQATLYRDNNSNENNPNNTPFILSMLKDANGDDVQFTGAYDEEGKVSTRWLYTYKNGVDYYDWGALTTSTELLPGIGYTQKGGGSLSEYIFEGKPNNGTIKIDVTDAGGPGSVPAVSKTEYLLGNPYPSALDIHAFIDDNEGVITGPLHLWQQWSGASHNLDEYDGGYATVNKTGATRAHQFVGLEGGATSETIDVAKTPSRYLSVGQGFIVEIVSSGTVVFRNSQRVFIKEADADGSSDNGSVFFRGVSNSENEAATEDENSEEGLMQKLRLEFNSVDGPATRRELLLGFSEYTSDDYDYGYDAKTVEEYNDDLNLVLEDELMTIQAYGEITQDKTVPLKLKTSGSYNYTIALKVIENISEDQELYLKDNFTGEYFDLRNEMPYEFSSEVGEFANRFEIVFQSESEMLSLEDATLEDLFLYYTMSRNKIVVLNPNYKKIKSIEVYNISGQSVYRNDNIYEGTYNEFQLGSLSTGSYIVKLSTADNSVLTKKIIVNK